LAIGSAQADTVAIQRPGDASSVVYNDVKITNIAKSAIVFTTSSGNTVRKDLTTVAAMTIDDEPQFNLAQQDYGSGRFDKALDEYDQTIQSTSKPWLKAYCMPRFTDAANKTNRFDKAVQGYIALVMNKSADAAAYRPTAPSADTQGLDTIAQSLDDAAGAGNLSKQQQAALLSLLLDVDRARNDTQAIVSVASKLKQLNGDAGGTTSNDASLALADAKLQQASDALGAKNYDQAIGTITASGGLFLDPGRQADALYILAQAHEGQARAKGDADNWRDAAIAYMRVVANFKDSPGAPHVADSLVATAAILENHLNQGGKAMKLDQAIQSNYQGTPAAEEAAKQLARLQAAGVQPD
jgi:tetratricopeptide (TPR) repeat protein